MREEWRERTDRMQSEIRLATARAREDLDAQARLAGRGKIPPALALLAKIGESRRPPKR
jgi:hypothetical protein